MTDRSFSRSLLWKPFAPACGDTICGTASASTVVTNNRDTGVNRFMGRYSNGPYQQKVKDRVMIVAFRLRETLLANHLTPPGCVW